MVVPETEIVVTKDGAEILRKTVRPGDYVIGRDAGCEVQVDVDLVASRHAQLTVNFDHVLIEDLGSDSGTFVNGQRVTTATRLWPSQKIQVGGATITLRRKRVPTGSEKSLAPQTEVVRRLLPEEILREQKYDIGGQIAQGGMGAILSAKEIAIRREVAMKVMLGSGGQEDLLRFVEEAQITGQLEHPNIVPVHELSVDENDQVFYTMKLVRGVTLRRVLEELSKGDAGTIQKYPLSALLTIFQKVCDAVAFAHSKGVIHRDLKPDNIMLGDFGEVLVMDWGLAKAVGCRPSVSDGTHPTASGTDALPSPEASRTLAGSIMGTPQYMAPEQARGEIDALDARSDIYALGAILYHLLTLHPPVEGATLDEILAKVSAGQFIPPIQRALHAKPRPTVPAPLPKPDHPLPQAIDPDAPTLVHTEGADVPGQPGREAAPRVPQSPGAKYQGTRGAASLPHLPGGAVPESLNAVVLKAMALEQATRYQNIAELQADLTAYQTGFATRAENANFVKQLVLLIKRHKGIFATALAAWLIITALAGWFIISIRASERETRRQAEIAKENEKQAEHNAALAEANEHEAVQRGEATRRALARSQIALAEAAYRSGNASEMQAALNEVPENLRDADWNYLSARTDMSIAAVPLGTLDAVAAHPTAPGVFAISSWDKGRKVMLFLRARTGEKLLEFEPVFSAEHDPKSTAWTFAFSGDGKRIVIGHNGKGILVCDTADGKKVAEWESLASAALRFSPDGRTLLQLFYENGSGGGIALLDSATGQELWARTGLKPKATTIAFTPDGKEILWQHLRERPGVNTLEIVNSADGSMLREMMTWVESLAVTRDSSSVLIGGLRGEVSAFRLKDGQRLFGGFVHDQSITNLAITPDGNRFVAVSLQSDGRQSLQICKVATGKPLETLLGGRGRVNALSVHPITGELFVAGPESRVWNIANPPEIYRSPKSNSAAQFWGSDDVLFVPQQRGGYADLWNIRDGKSLWEEPGGEYRSFVHISGNGQFAVVNTNPLSILKWNDGKPESVTTTIPAPRTNQINRLSSDAARLATSDWQRAEVSDTLKGTKICDLKITRANQIRDLGWVAGDSRIVGIATMNQERGSPTSEERIVLWDASTGEQVQSIISPTALDILAISPDGLSFIEAGADRHVRIRDANSLAVKQEFRVHDDRISALAWHPSKPILATGSADFSVKLWNLETGRSLEEIHGLLGIPQTLSFSPGGTRLACAVDADAVHVWEPQSLKAEAKNGDNR